MEHLLKVSGSGNAPTQLLRSALSKISAVELVRSLLVVSIVAMGSYAHALGVGVAESNSYIGEQLSVRVPLFNVVDPDSLKIEFASHQFGAEDQVKVSATLDRSNSQLAIRLVSNNVVNEPYLNFTLNLSDAKAELSKEFTVLLNLRPNVDSRFSESGSALPQRSSYQVSGLSNKSVSSLASPSVMGPYEYAQAGQIPEKFGAVLDGQSLWRVARRINSAMGVSRDQMMWALYQANPEAFSDSTVGSLKAGSYLTIPSERVVKRVSARQARINLTNLSEVTVANSSSSASQDNVSPDEYNISDDRLQLAESGDGEDGAPAFQVTGIGESAQPKNENSPDSEKVIVSLTETVGNLSQQLERKDRKIEFLEKQVAELKQYISGDALLIDQSGDSTMTEVPLNSIDESKKLESQLAVSSANDASSIAQSIPIWQWMLLGFFGLSLIAFLGRERVANLIKSLNLFGDDEVVSFEQATEQKAEGIVHNEAIVDTHKLDGKDYSIMSAVNHSLENKDLLDGISYLDFADDGSYEPNDILEFVTEEADSSDGHNIEDLTFDERFESLLDEKDFDFARELLDFARYNEIDEDRYHCERLRLFEKMKDEDGFYEYYYEIEAKIPMFAQSLQTKISQLVVQLAHPS